MADRITANLPSRDFTATIAFYTQPGFTSGFHDDGWLILNRGPLELEFFPHPGLDRLKSWFSACIRVDELDALWRTWSSIGLSANAEATLCMSGIFKQNNAPRMFTLGDPDGSLLRVLDNRDRT